MKILALSFFDPASVVLSHRDLMRAAGHDFRLAVVRAYTQRQSQADYVSEKLAVKTTPFGPGVARREVTFEKVPFNREALQAFANEADIIQFHPGIGTGAGDWATSGEPYGVAPEITATLNALGFQHTASCKTRVAFIHGSNSTWKHRAIYRSVLHGSFHVAASTLDYATELDAAYLPSFVSVGTRQAPLRTADDPLIIAHTPTDRVACSTDAFIKSANAVGAVIRLGEFLPHADCLNLKAGCHVGFDHLRGSFSVNTLENAALGLVTLFGLSDRCRERLLAEGINDDGAVTPVDGGGLQVRSRPIQSVEELGYVLRMLERDIQLTRWFQQKARGWFLKNFNADAITQRLTRFYESL